MPGAGKLRDRLRFGQRALDGNGRRTGAFAPVFTAWAEVDYQRGSESAVSSRLQGSQPAQIAVRLDSRTRALDTSFSAEVIGGVRNGEIFDIKSVTPHRDPGFLNLLGVSGGAAG